MAESYTLEAQARTITGKKVSQLRTQGLVPAVIYGTRVAPVHLQVPYRALQVALMKAGGTHLIDISIDGQAHSVLARQVQRDVIRGEIIHVDFFAVDVNVKISTNVPIHFVGDSSAVDTNIGVLTTVSPTLTVEALPRDLISVIEVDISGLKAVGDSIHVRDLKVSDKVTILAEPDDVVARITGATVAPTDEEIAAENAGSAEPEVIKKGKDDEDDE